MGNRIRSTDHFLCSIFHFSDLCAHPGNGDLGALYLYLPVNRRSTNEGIDAVKLSARAALGNFFPLLGLLLLTGVLGFCGALLCYVGMFSCVPGDVCGDVHRL
jgi:hypothetical protein